MKKDNDNRKKNIFKSFLKFALNVLILFLVFSLGAYMAVESEVIKRTAEKEVVFIGKLLGKYQSNEDRLVQNIDFSLYWDTWDEIKESHIGNNEISDKKLFYGSLEGMVRAIDDPYSEFMDPKLTREFEENMSGSFEGIGAEIGIRDGVLTIISPLSGTPADRAGLKPGDKILEINGETTEKMNINEAVSKIRGEKGTEVKLSIYTQEMNEIKDVLIIRDTIIIESVKLEILEENIFLIEISAFNSDTRSLFSKFAKKAFDEKASGIILDLRNNPGGYLDSSVFVLGEWVNGKRALMEIFNDGREVEYVAKGSNYLENIPTVVLINYGSASASEIVSGALQDYEKATIIGTKSYGKGSVQMVKNMKDGSSIKLTIAKWLTPLGQNINEAGITPDEEVIITEDDYLNDKDSQIERALELLKK
ncbi:MAG: S41 family peptidase [Patescibacteria group bacterium]